MYFSRYILSVFIPILTRRKAGVFSLDKRCFLLYNNKRYITTVIYGGVGMPPKAKVTKEAVLAAAVALVRREGAGALNARALAGEVGCSTQPLFTHYPTMDRLKAAVIEEATAYWLRCIDEEYATEKWTPYKAMGMAYWRFAATERELFKLLFMRDRSGEELTTDASFDMAVAAIQQANGLSREAAERFHMVM